MAMPNGIDVAGYQADEFATSGVDFVVIKVTEGTSYKNPRYAAQLAHARSAGLIVGHYHYGHHGKGAAEAAYFLANAKAAPGDFFAYDWEDGATNQTDRDAFMHAAKTARPSVKLLLYCNKSFWRTRDSESYAGDGLWIADPSSAPGHPDVVHPWVLHQYSETGGIDHNVANFTSVSAMRTWLGASPAPIPTPTEEDMPTAVDVWSYKHAPADTHDMHQALVNAETDSAKAVAAVAALSAKVDKLAAAPPQTLDYAQLAAALIAALAPKAA